MTVELVTGRDVMCELTRHRLSSFAIQSQRYVRDNKSGDIAFIKPDFYIPSGTVSPDAKAYCASREWDATMLDIERSYAKLINVYGRSAQDARKILPNSTATHIVMKANIREWRHILALRGSKAAYPEMQTLMKLLLARAKEVVPLVFDDLGDGAGEATWDARQEM